VFPSESHEREYGSSNPTVLEQSNDKDNDSGVDESEIQYSIGSFEMSAILALSLRTPLENTSGTSPCTY